MSGTAIHVSPYGGYDIPGLESWLASMAAKGLRFSSTAGPLILLEKAAPETVQVHLEPIRGCAEEDPDLSALYAAAGWRYWGMFRGSFFVYATPDLEAKAHTDPETQDYALKKFFRSKLAVGVLLAALHFLLLGLYQSGAPWEIDWTALRYFPVETLSNGTIIPFFLAALGLLLLDLSYLLGLGQLLRYRRAVRTGVRRRSRRGAGWLLAAGWLLLLPVLVNTAQFFAGLDYRPYDLEGSGFVTLTDIEGAEFPISRREFYDRISHGGSLLEPEYWYFRQYGAFGQDQSPDDVPHLEISIARYPLKGLAVRRAEEWSRQYYNGSGEYMTLSPAYGLDEIRYAVREGRTHTSELTGETHVFLPGGIFILRRGNTVLFADYYGEQDLSLHLEAFARMLEEL